MTIRALDSIVVDQIAAGEVVERPASVVKELVENALDAGATQIDILLREGGVRLVEVRDNGDGIPAEELPLAVASHATSKLSCSEDLEAIASLGFRGEALASIAAVSRFEIISKVNQAEAAKLTVEFGKVGVVKAAAGAPGTLIRVHDLFSQLPVRLKFLKRESTELSHCTAWVERLALVHQGVGFRLEHNGKLLLEISADANLEARCQAVYGKGLGERMVVVKRSRENLDLMARVGPPESARRNAKRVDLFLNGRWVRDPRLLGAVRQGVSEFVPPGHYPVVYLSLTIPPDRIDVNVHPQKTEVRFRDERLVFGSLVNAMREGLSSTGWATRVVGPIGGTSTETSVRTAGAEHYSTASQVEESTYLPLDGHPDDFGRGPLVSIGRTFLVREVEGGMEILDQHALHERVNLEELRRDIKNEQVVSQPLLIPELVEVRRAELELLLTHQKVFRSLGVELEAFGETTVALRAVPGRLHRLKPASLVQDLIEIAEENRSASPEKLQEETLFRMACRGAVMAGDHLQEEDLRGLLKRGANLPQDRTCAHGRPVRVFLSMADLEKAFFRRV